MLFGIPRSSVPNLYVLGVAWDGSSSFRRGASGAPRVIRAATSEALYNSFTEDLVDLREAWSYDDLGDVAGSTFGEIVERVKSIVTSRYLGQLFLFLGGDHSITYATVRALKEASPEGFGLVYFDAHPDLYESYEGDPYSHACVLRRIVEDGLVHPSNIVIVGVRAPTREQIVYAEEAGIKIITASEARRLTELNLSFDRAYISFDLDVLDPAHAPGVGNPEPGGLSTRELVDLVRSLRVDVIGFDVVELIPSYDCSGITAYAAAKIIRETLGLAARGARRPG
ncbi:MAG: agmatinase [Desulfurococcales archaeon]|nr:agmatinase [Desulfurococcales archaeon]